MRFEALLELMGRRTASLYYRCGLSLLLLAILYVSAQWAVSPVPLVASPHDIIGYIDAGYRITLGQVPHNDFSTQLGPLFSYLYALGVEIFGPRVSAVVGANLLVTVVTTSIAWLVTRRRLTPLLALLFSATVMATTSGVAPIGWDMDATDYAMSYNRHGYGILMCICAACFFPKLEKETALLDTFEDVLVGVLLSFLLFLKLNFFVMGVAALMVSPFFLALDRKRLGWACCGSLLPILLFWLLGVRPLAFINDMTMLYTVVHEMRSSVSGPLLNLAANVPITLCTIVFAIGSTAWLSVTSQKGHTDSPLRTVVAAVFLLGADLILGISNTQIPTLVLVPFIAIVLLRELQTMPASGSRTVSVLALLLLAMSTQTVIREASYIGYTACVERSIDKRDVSAQRLDAPLLKDMYVPSHRNTLSRYPQIVNDGLRLLRKNVSRSDRLVALNVSNPFDFTLGLQPAKGTALYWWLGASYTFDRYLPPEQVFSDATAVIIERFYVDEFWPIYGEYIETHFTEVGRTEIWLLFKRGANKLPNA